MAKKTPTPTPAQAPTPSVLRTPHMKRMQAARTTLLLDQPFFGVLALALTLIEDPTCKTAYTNGRVLGYSPKFIDTLDNDELVGLIAHEVMHCAAGHPWRRENRHPKKFNIAADYAINSILAEAKFKLPKGALLDDAQFKGKWAEWIYDRLPDSPDSGDGQGDPSDFGEVRDADDGASPDGTPAPTEADWQQNVRQAVKQAQGKLPASLKRELDELTAPRVDWRSLLRKYMQDACKSDYTWTRPNVRYMASGIYLPSIASREAMGRIAIAVDTSGSVDGVLLSQFAGEMRSIIEDMQPSATDVLYCDAEVHRVDTFERGDSLTIDAVGGGGTSFAPVFERIAQADETPVVLVYFTDLYGSFPPVPPDYPVIWAVYSPATEVPFGDVVTCQ